MQVSNIKVYSGLKQTKKHGSFDFPLAVYTYNFNLLGDGYSRWHWHKEVQFSFSLLNKVIFIIDNQQIILEPGEGIMINTNVMHKIRPYKDNCIMFTIIFDSILIEGDYHSLIENKYVKPILENSDCKFIYLTPNINWQQNILKFVKEIFILYNQEDYGYELKIRNCLGNIWSNLVMEMREKITNYKPVVSYDEDRIKLALEYIHIEYRNKYLNI